MVLRHLSFALIINDLWNRPFCVEKRSVLEPQTACFILRNGLFRKPKWHVLKCCQDISHNRACSQGYPLALDLLLLGVHKHDHDFLFPFPVWKCRGHIIALEVKSGKLGMNSGLPNFVEHFHPERSLVIGTNGISLSDFFSVSVEDVIAWFRPLRARKYCFRMGTGRLLRQGLQKLIRFLVARQFL